MASLIRISEAAALGLHALAFIADKKGDWVSTASSAKFCGASRNHMSKVCQRLATAGYLEVQRGKWGGFRLQKSALKIRLIEVLRLFDGEQKGLACLVGMGPGKKTGPPVCIFGPRLAALHRAILKYFYETRVRDIVAECHRAGPIAMPEMGD